MFSSLVKKNPGQINAFVTVGYLMMGIGIQLVLLDVPVGNLICRFLKTEKYEFSQSMDTFTLDFIPLLQTAWSGKELMRKTTEILNKRKRKDVIIAGINTAKSTMFPQSFYRKKLYHQQ
ncbi:unnamed protein product [Rhizopus stolonifer]